MRICRYVFLHYKEVAKYLPTEGTVQLGDLPNLCLLLILTVYLHITYCGMAGRRAVSVVCILPAAQRRGYLVDIGSAHKPWSSLGLGVSRRVLLHP